MKVLNGKIIDRGSLKATADISIAKWGGFVLRKVTFYQKGNQQWVCLPSESYEKDGEKKYYPLNTFEDKEMESKFKDKVRETIKEWINQQVGHAGF